MSDSLDELERLARAARGEAPDPSVREQTLDRLLAANVATVANTSSRHNVLFVLAAAATVVLVTGAYVGREVTPPIAAERLPASASAPRRDGVAPSPSAPLVPGPDMPAPPSSTLAPVTSPKAPPRPSASSARPLSLEEETQALEAVQAELRAGRASTALGLLDRYERAARGGSMATEAHWLRIEALARSGNAAAAARRAQEFVSAYPNSPLVDRARKYLAPASAGSDTETNGENGRQTGDE